jgi:hypothetical protein
VHLSAKKKASPMKRRISNGLTRLGIVLVSIVGLALISVFAIFAFNRQTEEYSVLGSTVQAVGVLCFIGILYYLFSGRYYTVEFDKDFIYYSRFKKKGQIRLDRIVYIRPSIFPWGRAFDNKTYSVTIEYLDSDEMTRKIKFMSRPAGINGTIDDIPFLDMLKEMAREKQSRLHGLPLSNVLNITMYRCAKSKTIKKSQFNIGTNAHFFYLKV